MKLYRKLKQKFTGKQRKYYFAAVGIILLASVLRFYNFQNEWQIWTDQAQFAILARYSLFNFKLPLLGQFSSAGPFQVGGEWYWFLMIGQALYPFSFITQWIWLVFLFIVFVGLIMYLAYKLVSWRFALIVGLLAAVSPAEISQGYSLANLSPIPFFTLVAIIFAVRFIRARRLVDLYILAFICGLAPTFHPQGFALMFLLLVTFLLGGKPKIGYLLVFPLLLLSWVPVFIADSQEHFRNTQAMFQYYLHDQYKVSLDVLGRRWSTYLGLFIPQAWAYIIGGYNLIAYAIMAGVGLLGVLKLFKHRMVSREWLLLIITFILMLIQFRYAHVPLYDSYLLSLHPFILLFTGYLICVILDSYLWLGLAVLAVILAGSLFRYVQDESLTNSTANQVVKMENFLTQKYPRQSFALYDYQDSAVGMSESLSLFLYGDNIISDNGKKIGIAKGVTKGTPVARYPVIYGKTAQYQLLDLSKISTSQIKNQNWDFINPSAIYHKVEEWFKN